MMFSVTENMRKTFLRLRSIFRRNRVEEELDEELRFHLEYQTRENKARGMEEREARRQAFLTLDGLERCKEECRDMRHVNLIDDLFKDLAFAGRTLRKSPLFAAAAAATIALGIGASTAIFSVVKQCCCAPFPTGTRPSGPGVPRQSGRPVGVGQLPLFQRRFHGPARRHDGPLRRHGRRRLVSRVCPP